MNTINNRILHKSVPGTFHKNNDNLKTIFRNVGIFVALTLAVMGVPGASASPVVYDPVSQFYTQAPLNQNVAAVQSGTNGWYYQYSASSASSGGPGTNSGNHTLLTQTYNQSPYQSFVAADSAPPTYALYSLWALGAADANTGYPSLIFNNNAGRLGLAVGSSLPGSAWSDTILTWQAPSAGTVDVSYNVSAIAYSGQNSGPVYAEIDLWNGVTVSNVSARQSLAVGGSSTIFAATSVAVAAGDQIQFWRNGYSTQSAQLLLDGMITFTAVPEPSTWALLAFGLTTVMILHRRRSRA